MIGILRSISATCRVMFFDQIKRFQPIVGDPDHIQVLRSTEDGIQPLADDFLIIADDER